MTTTGLVAATTIPVLTKIDTWGFVNLDLDGVLRSWASNGTVLDAAPLDPDQIAEFIKMREGVVEAQRTIDEKLIFADINGLDVPATEFLGPPQNIIPVDEIVNAENVRIAHGGLRPVPVADALAARSCVPAYCQINFDCAIYVGCGACYASVCWGLMG